MDIITQGLIGATVSQSVAKKEHTVQATIIGFLSGMLADVDVLIRSSTDPLLSLEYHRHFTHSIFFIPIGASIAFLILWPFFKNKLENKQLYLFCFTGYLFSGFIDTCTSYGTHLLWPLTNERISWHIISIVDPIFSGILLIAIILCVSRKKNIYSRAGLILVAGYLILGLIQLNRAETVIYELAQKRGHQIEKLIVKPTIGNNILWRSVYLADNKFYVDAVRVGLSKRVYEGDSIEKYFNTYLDKESVLAKDIKRFELFSDGFVVEYPNKSNVLGDIRYSMNPIDLNPLWGIELNFKNTNKHIAYNFYRESSKETRNQFLDMLMNRTISK